MVPPPAFSPFALPGQRLLRSSEGEAQEAQVFPLALQTDISLASLDDFVAAIDSLATKDVLKPLLHQHGGAILFRGTHAKSPEDFSRIVHAFKLGTPHEELGNPVVRNILAKNVATANEGPHTHPVFPHSEFGWSAHYPGYIVFFGRSAADSGGETPINSTTEVFQRLQAEVPEFIEELAKKGTRYVYTYPRDVNPGSNLGNNVRRAYPEAGLTDTDDEATLRRKVEAQIQRHSKEWRWLDDGSLETVHYVPALRRHPLTGDAVWFGNIVSMYALAQKWEALEPPYIGTDGAYHHLPTYGDGSPIPHEYLQRAYDIIKEIRVLIDWQVGDVLLLDNHYVQHAREPWTGDRRVLASLWDGPPALPFEL